MPSNNTDFPNNNPNTIQLHVTSAKKNIIGDYHVTGEIVNAGNDTIQSVKVIVHTYDGSNRLIEHLLLHHAYQYRSWTFSSF